ncbi:hypothetical protein [Sediminibacterium sp.]|uniref:hypothetical protein n=1 Tax=Sediminibacterium sp. TaxID=1917865 RepID=UPI003F6EE171
MQFRYIKFPLLLLVFLLPEAEVVAQTAKSTFVVSHTLINNTTLNVPGTELFFQSNKTTTTQFNVLQAQDENFQLLATVLSVKGKLYAFGQEQIFNSSDTAGLNSSELNWLKEIVNKPKAIEIKNFHAQQSPVQTNSLFDIDQEDAGKYFLPFPPSIIKMGLTWSDTSFADSSKTIHEYLVLKVQDNKATISVFSELFIKTSFTQSGQTIRQQLKGLARAERIYDLLIGKMISESVTTKLSGSSNNGTDIVPITIELKGNSLVSFK